MCMSVSPLYSSIVLHPLCYVHFVQSVVCSCYSLLLMYFSLSLCLCLCLCVCRCCVCRCCVLCVVRVFVRSVCLFCSLIHIGVGFVLGLGGGYGFVGSASQLCTLDAICDTVFASLPSTEQAQAQAQAQSPSPSPSPYPLVAELTANVPRETRDAYLALKAADMNATRRIIDKIGKFGNKDQIIAIKVITTQITHNHTTHITDTSTSAKAYVVLCLCCLCCFCCLMCGVVRFRTFCEFCCVVAYVALRCLSVAC